MLFALEVIFKKYSEFGSEEVEVVRIDELESMSGFCNGDEIFGKLIGMACGATTNLQCYQC